VRRPADLGLGPAEVPARRPSLTPLPLPRLRVVALGGGTGLPRVLAGLSALGPTRGGLDVTAIVTTCDDGGSSGELRRQYGMPSPGDIRNCLVALAGEPGPLAALFQHRFEGEGGLGGHTVGNLVIAALTQQLGDFGAAVRAAGELVGARGQVLPATDGVVELVATLDVGRVVRGESAIAAARGRVGRIALDRASPAPSAALDALRAADLLVFGPGSLYSSVVATLLAGGVGDAIAASRAERVLVVNLFTQPGETDGYAASDHVRAIQHHLGPVVDTVLVHSDPLPAELVEIFAARGSHPVAVDRDALAALGIEVVEADLLAREGSGRHDPSRLAAALTGIATVRRSG
jgi:uncharacterized cofD-like protein